MIWFDEIKRVFWLETDHAVYAMAIMDDHMLCHLYWGKTLGGVDDLPTVEEQLARYHGGFITQSWYQEYPGWGDQYYNMHALKVTFGDGTRNALLRYAEHSIEGETLVITLCDPLGLTVEVKYVLHPELDVIDRSARITNTGSTAMTLENAFSAVWRFPETGDYRLTYLSGGWGQEYQLAREVLQRGVKLLETKNGVSGAKHAPLFMLDRNAKSAETEGDVYFGTLQWSGPFRFYVERDEYNNFSVAGGITDFDFAWPLKPGESFETPVFIGGMAFEGFSDASRRLHSYQRRYLMRPQDADRVMPVILNTYGTFLGNVDEQKVMGIVERASRVGAEAFIIDAGWSGRGDHYQLGMGDWNINPERFPGQLKNISKAVHAQGMKFGLWFEPETAHIDSQLVREHPDWIRKYPGRPMEAVHKGRVCLNFALDEVWQDILEKISRLIVECELDYFKMDYMVAESGGTPLLASDEQKTLWVRHAQNLHKFYNALVERHPHVLVENCAGGGQRVDLGMSTFSGRINRSDNQDPLDALKIHEGFTYFMPSKFAGGGCHISKAFPPSTNGRISTTRFQAHVAMMGSLAIGENLVDCTEEELDEIAALVKRHKQLRHIPHLGEIYRLASAWEEPYAIFEFVLPDRSEAAVFVYGQSMQLGRRATRRIQLKGLDPLAQYEVEGFGQRSGAGLMNAGLSFPLRGDMDCLAVHIRRVDG